MVNKPPHVRWFIDKKRIFPIDKSSFRDIFDSRMTIYKVARGYVDGRFLIRGKERILGCEIVEPSDVPYSLDHAGVHMMFAVSPDDKVDIDLKLLSARPAMLKLSGSAMLGMMALDQAGEDNRQGNEKLGFTPKFGQVVVEVGPDRDGVTIKLERHGNIAPTVFGADKLKYIKPKVNKLTTFGGARSG